MDWDLLFSDPNVYAEIIGVVLTVVMVCVGKALKLL